MTPQYQVLNYRIDFAVPDKRIAIEIDGHEYHKTKEQRTHDSQREREIKLVLPANWTVIRFTGSEIFQNATLFVDEVLQFISKNSHHNNKIIALGDNVYAFLRSMIKRKSSITKNANDWRSKGLALFTQEKYDDAIQANDKAFEIDPKNASAWTGKGDALKNHGKCDEAVLALDKSLEIDSQSSAGVTKADPSSNPHYWVTKALKLWDYNGIYPFDTSTINKDNYKEAIECFNNAIAIDPFKTSWYYAKARICTALSFYAKDMHIQDEFDHYFNETIEIYKKA